MKLTLTALTVGATMLASSASAFDPDDVQKLRDTNVCLSCDLRVANMVGAQLGGANLLGANLSGANLEGADLAYTSMNDAILCNTIMPDGSVIYSGC